VAGQRRIVWASVVLLVAALAFYGIGLTLGAFADVPSALVGGFPTIGGLILTVIGARARG
jgi:hypothetical protein